MELTSFKPRSLPLIQNIQIESKCIRFRGLKRKGLWQSGVSGLKCGCCRAGNNVIAPPLHLRAGSSGLAGGARPRLSLLCSLLPTAASVSSQSVMDDHNNAACLAPWQTVLAELMKACRLHTQGAPPGQQALLSLELASSLVGKDFFLMPLRWHNRRQKESRFQGCRCGSVDGVCLACIRLRLWVQSPAMHKPSIVAQTYYPSTPVQEECQSYPQLHSLSYVRSCLKRDQGR